MARSKRTAAPKPQPEAAPAIAPVAGKAKATKLAPLEKRLGKLRKEEAKRQKQLHAVQKKTARASEEMARRLASVTDWLEHPQAKASTEPGPKNGVAEPVAAGR
jgi:hypothetical protein